MTPPLFDIYEDTCLHAGVMADGIAARINPEDETLSKTLEETAVVHYRRSPGFRARLAACHHKTKASEAEARQARGWLEATMTRWAIEIQSGARLRLIFTETLDRDIEKKLKPVAYRTCAKSPGL